MMPGLFPMENGMLPGQFQHNLKETTSKRKSKHKNSQDG